MRIARRVAVVYVSLVVVAILISPVWAARQRGMFWTDTTTLGVIDLELARRPARAQAILEAWRQKDEQANVGRAPAERVDTIAAARRATWWDYVFLAGYGFFLSIACRWAASLVAGCGPLARFGWAMVALVVLAAAFDAGENVGMLRMLDGQTAGNWPALTWWCALAKFVLLTLALLYLVATLGALTVSSARPEPVEQI